MRFLAALALGVLASTCTVQAKDYDVCVIGAGAGGTASAVYATKNGYSVLVVDAQSNLGGHCDTYNRPAGTVAPNSQPWIDTGVAQLADTQLINGVLEQQFGPLPSGKPRWQVDTKKYVNNFVNDSSYLVGLNIPQDPFTNTAAIYQEDFDAGFSLGPLSGQSLLPNASDPEVQRIFGDLVTLTTQTYPWIDNGELDGPVPDELLVPFAQFMQQRGWTNSPSMVTLFTSILWYAVAMDKFENLATYYALRFLSPTPQLLFNGADFWYGFNGGCQRLYDNIYQQLQSRPYNAVLVNTTVTQVHRPQPSWLDFLIPPKNTVRGFTLGVDKKGAKTNTSFSHECGAVIFGMPAVPASLSAIGLKLDAKELGVFGTVKTHGYFGGAVQGTGRALNETASTGNLYNILHVNVEDPFGLSRGDPTWISLQGAYGPGAPSLFAGFSSVDMSQAAARAEMQKQLTAQLTVPVTGQDGTVTPPVFDTVQIVDFHAHRYQARPALEQLSAKVRPSGFYSDIRALQGHLHTYWTGATVNFPLHHVCMNEAYKLIQQYFPNKCNPWNPLSYIICLAQGRKVDWDL